MTRTTTAILLATYNGAAYLQDLLRSLDEQTDQNWGLIARDDGSTDDTVSILKAWGKGREDRFRLIEDDRGNLGAALNFGVLLEACDADYFLLCGQDDVWFTDKIERLRNRIRLEENGAPTGTPIIVHTDAVVVDAELKELSPSFWSYQSIGRLPERDPWKRIVLQNVVTGCAMIGNRPLLRVALPVSEKAIAEDWWLGLVCASTGRLVFDAKPSLLYRQHGANTAGAMRYSTIGFLSLGIREPAEAIRKFRLFLGNTRDQAGAAVSLLGDSVGKESVEFLRVYATLNQSNYFVRCSFLFRHGLFFKGYARNLALLAVI